MILHDNAKHTLSNMGDNTIDLTITSPPYYNAKDYITYKSLDHYFDVMEDIFTELLRVTKLSRMCAVNISPVLVPRESRSKQSYRIPLPFRFVTMMTKIGWEFLEDIIWVKPSGAVPNRNGGFYRHRKPVAYKPNVVTEYIFVFKKPAPFLIDKVLRKDSLVTGEYEKTNLWYINPETRSKHPAPFPLELPSKLIKYYSYEGETVLDIFAGSGTTGLAAKQLNREFIMVEQEKEYVEMMEKRLC